MIGRPEDIAVGVYVVIWIVLTVWMWIDGADVCNPERDGSPLLWAALWPLWLLVWVAASLIERIAKAPATGGE